jgi:hypothetical protein
MIMSVAVFCDQHSMRLGHFALSQTVSNPSPSINLEVNCNPPPNGKLRLSQRGSRGSEAIGSAPEAEPPQLPPISFDDRTGKSNCTERTSGTRMTVRSQQRMARMYMIALAIQFGSQGLDYGRADAGHFDRLLALEL